ncbi:MAG TPA: thioesterase family protein [Terrimesophilobacter sp.]|nr:thioesterase family protein [Terrimesophilobacter sp.]
MATEKEFLVRIHIPVHVRWGDLDAYNHVNNVQMLRILEEARVRALWAPDARGGDDANTPPTAVISAAAGADTTTLIAGHQIEYLLPVEYQRNPLDVQLWIGRFGGASAEISYEVYCNDGLAVRAASTMVFMDSATGRPRRISDAERAAWADYVEEPVQLRSRS